MSTAASISRLTFDHPSGLTMNAFNVIAGDVFVLQWQSTRSDITGCEAALDCELRPAGWQVAGPILGAGEGTWKVDLMPAAASS